MEGPRRPLWREGERKGEWNGGGRKIGSGKHWRLLSRGEGDAVIMSELLTHSYSM